MQNTREIAAEYRLSHWAQIIRERRESGQSIKSFCQQIGICGNTYYYWQRKLREAASEQMETSGQTKLVTQGFTEIQLSELSAHQPMAGQLHIEVGGVQITADSGYPPEQLAALLRELKRPC